MNWRYVLVTLISLACVLLIVAGCEKGALGVKKSLIIGRIVDADSPTTPVPGVNVSLYSRNPSAGNSEVAIGQYFSTITDSNGKFVFENVGPDQMVLEATKNGYEDLVYPSASASVNVIYVGSDKVIDLGDLKMKKIGSLLNRETITVKGKILDELSKEELADNVILSFYFDGQKYQNKDITYAEFKSGLTIPAKNGDYELVIIAQNYSTYKNTDDPDNRVDGRVDNVLNIVLKPISYDVMVIFKNKPYYINNQVIELENGSFVNKNRDDKCKVMIIGKQDINGERKILASATSVDLNPYEPSVKLEKISLPAELRIFLSGYRLIATDVPFLPNRQGLIKMELDMMGPLFTNNVILRPVGFNLTIDAESTASPPYVITLNDNVQVVVNAVPRVDPVTGLVSGITDITWGPDRLGNLDVNDDPGINDPPVYRLLPCGYILPFNITVWESTNIRIINCTNYYYINPVREGEGTATETVRLLVSNKTLVLPR